MLIQPMSVGLLLAFGITLVSHAAGGGSAGGGAVDAQQRQLSPEAQAQSAYNQGVRVVQQADKSQQTASAATAGKKQAKEIGRANKLYKKASDYFAAAVEANPQMHEAWNYLGYTSRKLGQYGDALGAYDEALRLKPTYAEAIEYRAEAYLGLNRIEDAKGAYLHLFAAARPLADQLMAAMRKWITERRADAAGTAAADVDAFAQWIDERSTIARQTASLAIDGVHRQWN